MKRLLLVLAILPFFAHANPVDRSTAMRVAENFWWQEFKEQVTFKDYSSILNLTEIYLFEESNDRGYIVISADDCATPVLGYSHNEFRTHNICPSIVSWLHFYEEEIAYARNNGIKADETAQEEWDALTNGTPLPEPKASIQVDPLLSSAWDQGDPYNLYCPGEGSGKTPTGCVATAMAQVMYYWKYPQHGFGYNEYNYANYADTNFNWQYGTLSADFENTWYDWDNMVDTLRTTSDSASIKAVALLNYHCGIALNMLYKPGGSMAFVTMSDNILFGESHYPTSIAAENVIPRFFGYSQETTGKLRKNFTRDLDWINLLRDDLQKGRPIVFAGASAEGPSAGHCFIVDGCNPRLYFHINLGWGGDFDGEFRISSLTIERTSYNCRQQAIIGMRPPEMFSVKVTCSGEKGENCGVFHGENEVCNTFVNMVTGEPGSKLHLVANDGYTIKSIVWDNDTMTGNIDNIEYNLANRTTDANLEVVFAKDQLGISTASRQANLISAFANGKNIVLKGNTIGQGNVYDIMGRKVCDFDGHSSSSISIPVQQHGIYIVRHGGQSCKVVVSCQ